MNRDEEWFVPLDPASITPQVRMEVLDVNPTPQLEGFDIIHPSDVVQQLDGELLDRLIDFIGAGIPKPLIHRFSCHYDLKIDLTSPHNQMPKELHGSDEEKAAWEEREIEKIDNNSIRVENINSLGHAVSQFIAFLRI